MAYYQVMIEGIFVTMGAECGGNLGFHTTFYVNANNAPNAVHRARNLITSRMKAHDVGELKSSAFKTHYVVHDIWEVTDQKFNEHSGRDSGFTFFRIRPLERVQLALRHALLKITKPWRLVAIQGSDDLA